MVVAAAALRSLCRARMHLLSGSSCSQGLADGLRQASARRTHCAPLVGQVAMASASAPPSGTDAARLLGKLRLRQIRDTRKPAGKAHPQGGFEAGPAAERAVLASSFPELMLSEELMRAVQELDISKPTEVQCLGIPAIISGENVVLASHTGSGKTLAYMLPLVQCLRRDEMQSGKLTRPRRPRAIVLCPTRELAEQVFHVAKSICHHARFRSAMIGGGCRMRPQEDALNTPVDMLVGTPGRLLMHVSEGNMAYGDIKYVVLDEADTMFDHGFGPELQKFLGPLRNRSVKPGDEGFQTILVTATITKAVQKLLDTEFPGIRHLHTSTLHKKIPNARHGFIKLSGAENKLESLSQVLEPSLAKGDRVMVFCNTLNSCRAVDHFLNENNTRTVNYHGDVPAEQRVEGLNKFRSEDSDYRVLVCTDLAARGLDLVVDHVIMFDFPLNPIDYLHRTGRTARMGAKGKVTSLVSKKDFSLARQIEESVQKGETLETLTANRSRTETTKKKITTKSQKEKTRMVSRAKIETMKKQASTVKQKEKLRMVSMAKIETMKKQAPKVKQKENLRVASRTKIKTMKTQAPRVKQKEKPRHGKGDASQHKSSTKGIRVHKLSSKKASVVHLASRSTNGKSGVKNVVRDYSKKRVKHAIKV